MIIAIAWFAVGFIMSLCFLRECVKGGFIKVLDIFAMIVILVLGPISLASFLNDVKNEIIWRKKK